MIPNGSITLSSRRVLLIEHSPSDRQLLRNWMNSEMIETYEAVDIITAMAAFQKYSPNLILLQLRLPTWDGFEVIKRLKDDPRTRSVPVIFISASALTAEKAKGIDMGAVDFVSKPFDSVELLARVNSALRTKALLDLLEQRAHLDGLTELGNRFALQDEMPILFATCRNNGQPISMLILDIDHFKKINDHYGHAAGDEVLRRMAITLRESVRPTDFLARYGGEEFVVLCPDCDLATVMATAERVRQRVSEMEVLFRSSLIRLTSSVGVAGVDAQFAGRPDEVLDQADQALYRAKAHGRNAVWFWDEDAGTPAPIGSAVVSAKVARSPQANPEMTLTARIVAAHRASAAAQAPVTPVAPMTPDAPVAAVAPVPVPQAEVPVPAPIPVPAPAPVTSRPPPVVASPTPTPREAPAAKVSPAPTPTPNPSLPGPPSLPPKVSPPASPSPPRVTSPLAPAPPGGRRVGPPPPPPPPPPHHNPAGSANVAAPARCVPEPNAPAKSPAARALGF